MTKKSDTEARRRRQNIQVYFWGIVGASEHINIPKLEDAIKNEFKTSSDSLVQTQIRLMQTESRIRVQSKEKVWVKQPDTP